MVAPERDAHRVPCPDCDSGLERVGEWTESRLLPADRWRCPDCGARWVLDASGMLAEG